ncbi:HAMP domain-containing protein [Rhodopirellula sp. JC740]|uniref:histidine kinase n=1 Tax=Rhodopirellula halodulae TaxID=2894198 RepID=A0ABS8NLP0_9BACT|nr:ATP-binding protein [Rhodopirellula sp. JC740]MCC9644430.1 HAMP domain-containing protein [Rhodopirellula sp. JC740]
MPENSPPGADRAPEIGSASTVVNGNAAAETNADAIPASSAAVTADPAHPTAEESAQKWARRKRHPRTDSGVWRVGNQRRLFKWHSIQGKLLTGTLVLVTLIITLGVVGILGLNQYNDLAQEISARARELPCANQLAQLAAEARSHNRRLCQIRSEATMIDAYGVSSRNRQIEDHGFQESMKTIGEVLDEYEWVVNAKLAVNKDKSPNTVLIDPQMQARAVEGIRSTYDDIRVRQDMFHYNILLEGNGVNRLDETLGDLEKLTQEHQQLIHEEMSAFSDHVKNEYRLSNTIAWVAFGAALVIALLMIWIFHTSVLAPFNTLVLGARLVARGEFSHRIDLGTEDELGELSEILNQMTDRFQNSLSQIEKMCDDLDQEVKVRSQEVIRNEQLAGVGFLAAGFAHEINNPMAAIAWSAEAMESRMNDLMMLPNHERLLDEEMSDNWRENLQRIEGEAFRCKSIIEKMLLFSRMGQTEKSEFDIVPLVDDVLEMVTTLGKYKCQTVRRLGDDSAVVYANDQEIRQVVLNLVTNALESVDCDGSVHVHVHQGPKNSTVRVTDTGCGMSAEVQAHLFEPFFTRRRDGTGTGLGLSISHRIVCQHGGQLIGRSEGEDRGSEFELRLPVEAITEEVSSPAFEDWKFQHAQQTQAA